jgi:cytidyltransferase-like protein
MGGAAGHMAHPFDLSWVSSGPDLLDFFDRAKTFVEKKGAGAVKIDGVNVSFKVVGDDDIKQFAVDRGSLKPIDIEGITMRRVDDRFPEGHGMRPAIKSLLTILNAAIEKIQPELKQLGMWDDPSRFLNTEYVEGMTNVTQYDHNFLAIHGLNQFYSRIGKVGAAKGIERPGMQRPEGADAASVEIPYKAAVMESLVDKLRPYAEEYGFKVYSSVPTERMADIDIDYSQALSEPFTVRISDDREITKSLGEWLQEATNPRYKVVRLQDDFPELGLKKGTHALHKNLYVAILNQSRPITELIEGDDGEAAIYGAIFMHAARMLGNEILQGLTSPMGDVMGHEGIVLRDDKLFGPNPVKITGEFIVGNLGGGFGAMKEQDSPEEEVELDIVDAEVADVAPAAAAGITIAIVPGSFKPPHWGHLKMVEEYAANNEQVKVLISNPLKSQRTLADGSVITAQNALDMWNVLAGHLSNVDIEISNAASPLTATYDILAAPEPLNAGDVITLGASRKGGDWKRWVGAPNVKGVRQDLEFKDPSGTAVEPTKHSPEYMGNLKVSPFYEEMPSVAKGKNPMDFHASDMRYLLGKASEDAEAVELLEDFVGGPEAVMEFLSILGVDTGANEPGLEPPLEETSAAGGGAVEGPTAPFGQSMLDRKPKKKKRKAKQKEYIDLSLVDEVLELLIKRGIIL